MTNDMVRLLTNFSSESSNVYVEPHGEAKASENSRNVLLKALTFTLAALVPIVATPDASASTSFSDYKTQQMADFEKFKQPQMADFEKFKQPQQNAGGNELSAFEAEAIKSEMSISSGNNGPSR